ncbi:hypothetical protein MMC30_006244 [Trapelia coarctata]|nr:hypothetical protein [Trapelia coarctata]
MSSEPSDSKATTAVVGTVGASRVQDAGSADIAESEKEPPAIHRGWRFWAIFPALSITALLSAVEATVTSTALPTIVVDLEVGNNYTWIVNSFLLTSIAFQPMAGQIADIFGRRWPMIVSVAIFVLGSGICGGATSGSMLIAGRTIQGIGSGGLNMLIDLIVCDLVPLRERGKFTGIIFSIFTIGTSMGPFIGGAIAQHSNWRWIFYMNLPIGGVSLVLLFLFLHVNYNKEMPMKERCKRIDFIGNAILVASLTGILFGLTYGGTTYPWSSWHVVFPLVIGLVGLGLFHFYESRYSLEPTMPMRLFSNRTSASAFYLTFMHALLTLWVLYFLPVYFQGVLESSPTRSGVQLLPTVLALMPAAIASGFIVSKFGRYRPLHFAGMALMTVGFGLFTLLDANSSTAAWVCLQIVESIGSGLIVTALLQGVQAPLSEADTAIATATWAYVRSFGAIWGVTVPAAIFNNRFQQLLYRISDPTAVAALANGQAYAHASSGFLDSFSETVKAEIISVYVDSLKLSWIIATALAGISFFLVFFEKEIILRTTLDTEFGIKDRKKWNDEKTLESGVANGKPIDKAAEASEAIL